MPMPSSATISSISSPTCSTLSTICPLPLREGMLDGVGRQFVDQQAEGHGAVGIDFQRLGLDLDVDARCVSKQARRHGLGDFPQIGVHRDGAAAAGLRDQIVKLGDGADARLHGLVALHAWRRRPFDFVGDQADDDLQIVLDPVRDFVGQPERVALALLAVGDVLEHEQHAMGVVAGLRDLARIQVENAPAEAREIILDLEALDRLVFRQHLFHQMAQRRHVPLVLAQFGNAPPAGFRLGNPEHRQKRLARRHDRHVVFEHDQRIADGVDDALGQLPVALALLARRAFLADILDGEQDEAVMVAGAENLARIDQHGAPANGREIVLDLEAFDRRAMRDHAFEQSAQRGNIPLPVAEVVDQAAFGLVGAGAEGLVEGAIGGCDDSDFGRE